MTEPETGRPTDDQLLQEAATWFARMRGPDAQGSRADFEAWLARGALHRRAYNRAGEIFAMGKVLGEEPARTLPAAGQARWRMAALAIGGLAVVTAGMSWLVLRQGDMPGVSQSPGRRTEVVELTSPAGKLRELHLADGSMVRLQGGTRVAVLFDAAMRQLTLRAGQARFKVAHEARPFVVYAGGGSVTAHGTIFDVALLADRRVSVRLLEGVIDVRLPPAKAKAQGPIVRRLHRGEAIDYVAEGGGTAARNEEQPASDSERTAAAQQATQDYDQIRVADLIAQANRHASRPIRLAEPAIAQQRISGRFGIGDTDLLAERIAALFDLLVDRNDAREIILRRR